jgi:hypothetical protein
MREVIVIVRLLFSALGWVFNSKCVLEPSTSAIYNGMWIDSARYEMRAPDEKWEKARKLAWAIWYAALLISIAYRAAYHDCISNFLICWCIFVDI